MYKSVKVLYSVLKIKVYVALIAIIFLGLTAKTGFSLAEFLNQTEVSLDLIKTDPSYTKKFNVVKIINYNPDRERKSKLDEVFLLFHTNISVETAGEYEKTVYVGRESLKQIMDKYLMETKDLLDAGAPTIKTPSEPNRVLIYIFLGGRVENTDIWQEGKKIIIKVNYKPTSSGNQSRES